MVVIPGASTPSKIAWRRQHYPVSDWEAQVHFGTADRIGRGKATGFGHLHAVPLVWDVHMNNRKHMVTVPQPAEKRNEQRLAVDVPVEIITYDLEGNMFTERTRIEDITKMGCRFRANAQLQRGDIVLVRPLAASATRLNEGELELYEVRWTSPERGGWTTGTLKLEPEDLANRVFPPPNARHLPSR